MKTPVTLQVKYAGVCGSDLQKLSRPSKARFSFLGHEIVALQKDKYVVVNPLIGCQHCAYCQPGKVRFCKKLKALGRNAAGGFSGAVTVPRENIFPIKALRPEVGVLCDPYAVVVHGLKQAPAVDTLCIIGDGIIAQLCLLYAYFHPAHFRHIRLIAKTQPRATAIVKTYHQLFDRREITFVSSANGDISEEAPLVIEAVGRKQSSTLNQAIQLVAPGGTILGFGVYPAGYEPRLPIRDLLYKEAQIKGVNSYESNDFETALAQIESAESQFSCLLGTIYPSAEWRAALAEAKAKPDIVASKVVVSLG